MSPNRGDLGERGGTGGSQPCALLETAPFFSEFMKISRVHVSFPMKDGHENLQMGLPFRCSPVPEPRVSCEKLNLREWGEGRMG